MGGDAVPASDGAHTLIRFPLSRFAGEVGVRASWFDIASVPSSAFGTFSRQREKGKQTARIRALAFEG